jgi:hypothetical protein
MEKKVAEINKEHQSKIKIKQEEIKSLLNDIELLKMAQEKL